MANMNDKDGTAMEGEFLILGAELSGVPQLGYDPIRRTVYSRGVMLYAGLHKYVRREVTPWEPVAVLSEEKADLLDACIEVEQARACGTPVDTNALARIADWMRRLGLGPAARELQDHSVIQASWLAESLVERTKQEAQAPPTSLQDTKWHRHCNGGGWVAETASVDPGAFVYDDSYVYGSAQVSAGAVIGDCSHIYGSARIAGDVSYAKIAGRVSVGAGVSVGGTPRGELVLEGELYISAKRRR